MNILNSCLTRSLLILSCFCVGTFAKNKYNVSMLEMATCKEYDIRGVGYKYADFFYVHSLDNNKISDGERLHLKFYVQTSMDAHILLAVNSHPRIMDRVYEIVIGAGGNTFSAIRTSMGRRRVATNQEERLLSVLDPTPIEVIQLKDGNVLVYITGHTDGPLMNFTDASPLEINYVSFSSFGSIHARWFYDCKFDGFAAELEEVVRDVPPRQQLIANLTNWSENASLPMNLSFVNFLIQVRSVSYQQHTSILKTRVNIVMNWRDPRLQWDSSEFNGIETLAGRDFEIWTPTLVVLNGAYQSIGNLKLNPDVLLTDNGTVLLVAQDVELTTWCLNSNRDWPHEHIDCELTMGLNEYSLEDGVKQLPLNYTNLRTPQHDEEFAAYSEWALDYVSISRYENGSMARYTPKGIIQVMSGDIAVDLTISRNSQFYKSVFSMPVLTSHSLIIISFLLRGYRRGALMLVVFAILSLGIMFLTKHAAPGYVPNIMFAYQLNIFVTVYCYFLHIVIMWLEMFPPKTKPSGCVMAIVNSSPLRFMLCMRIADSTEFVKIQEYPWREIAKMLNSVNSFIVFVIFMVVNVMLLPTV